LIIIIIDFLKNENLVLLSMLERPILSTQTGDQCPNRNFLILVNIKYAKMANRGLLNSPAGRSSMKSYRKELWFTTGKRREFINITPQVEDCLRVSGIREGLILINAMHITASVFINDDESGLHQDYEEWLEKLAPHEPVAHYRHNRTGEDNGDAHLKRQIMGREVVVAVTDGSLDFGPWEQIFYGEFDGRRKKRVLVKIIGE
jgi:secondary thiamine-phosphate synthase enzyme